MICRPVGPNPTDFDNCDPRPADRPEGYWILISQVEHARLAYELACRWSASELWPRNELLWAVEHHDDGWRQWEELPGVDPETGQPIPFTEMPTDASLRIWTGSIETAADSGNLQAYVVAGHFALARRSADWRRHLPGWDEVEKFLAHYEARIAQWLAAWQAENPSANTLHRAEEALAHLRWFDALSLTLCCEAPLGHISQIRPDGEIVIIGPHGGPRLSFHPWSFTPRDFHLQAACRAVPRVFYPDRQSLAQAGVPTVLHWHLAAPFVHNPG